jgi:hypothetical protein
MDKNSVKKWFFVSHGKRVSLRVFGHLRPSTLRGSLGADRIAPTPEIFDGVS